MESKGHKLWRGRVRGLVGLAVVLLFTALILALKGSIARFQSLGYLGVFLISFFGNATVILPVPGLVATALGGMALSPLWVGLAAGPGLALGELTGYVAGYSGRSVLAERDPGGRVERWVARYGAWAIFLLAAVPNPFFDVAGMAAGAMRFPLGRFLIICLLGETLKALAVAYLGAGSSELWSRIF